MADKIGVNEIVEQAAIDQVKSAQAEIKALQDAYIKMAASIRGQDINIFKADGIKATQSAINQQKKDTDELTRIKERLIKAESDYGKAVAAAAVELQKQNTANKNAAREAQAAEDSVNRMSAALIRMRSEYDKLSKLDREGAKGKGLLGNIQALDIELKAIDGTLGRFGRNVGNYNMISEQLKTHLKSLTTQWDGLNRTMRGSPMGREMEANIRSTTNAIQLLGATAAPQAAKGTERFANSTFQLTQVLRELPAFTYSAQTGLMGVGNNIGPLADSFRRVKAETGSTGTALKVFASSLFSMGNILTIALGLFTIYSKEIFAMFEGTGKLNSAQKDLNKSVEEGNKNAIKEVTQLDVLYKTTQNTTLSIESRKKAVDKLQELYPSYFGNIKDEIILNGKAKDAYYEVRDAIFASARARAIQGTLEERAAARLEREMQLRADIERYDNLSKTAGATDATNYGRTDLSQPVNVKKSAEENRRIAEFQKQDAIKRLEQMRQASLKEDDLLLQAQQDYYAKSDKLEADRIKVKGSGSHINKGSKEKRKKEMQDYVHDLNELDRDVQLMNEKTDAATIERVKARLEAIKKLNAQYAKDELDLIRENLAAQERDWDRVDKERQDALTAQLNSLKMYGEIINTAVTLMSAITDIQYQREIAAIDARDKKLKDSYDAEKKYIDSSFTNQADKERELAALEARREAQQKKIDRDRIAAQRKAAIAQKGYDIASIISGTAVAVISALGAKPYTPLNIAIAAGVAATGAANLARVIATPLPQYFKGTESKPQDGPAWVGEKGVEKITLPDGTSFLSPGTATIMDLPKQTVIKPHEETMKELMYDINASVFRKLGKAGNTMNSTIAAAFIESIEENTSEIKGLRKDMNAKGTNVSIYGDYNHHIHVQTNIR